MGFWIAVSGVGRPVTIIFMKTKDPLHETSDEILDCMAVTKPHIAVIHPIFADAFAKHMLAGDDKVKSILQAPLMINATGSKVSKDTAHALRSNGISFVSKDSQKLMAA
jgi:hypothetical protein